MSPDNYTMVEKIEQLIEQYDLASKSRERDKVYFRSYIYWLLREDGWIMSDIGNLFNRDHATVINGLKVHEAYYKKDKVYMRFVRKLDEIFNPTIDEIMITKDTIFHDIMNCHNTTELRLIKEKIVSGWYDSVKM
ncbi:Chromosomal replication initiator, DnaA C-terminal [uncultured Caudovirales phage]|uniref:Chromosomal replication initiator, DnaA C-terminal n=1 Tax=uncultured Caudovirales phage TaxID=2100421 RepID=A0A6J5NWT9_9CAUD|nr:Chromosomal replication initiator, DnaA C-terminal [uncultured Caudovirales phage]